MQKSFSHVPRVIYSPFNFLWQTIFFSKQDYVQSFHFHEKKNFVFYIWIFFLVKMKLLTFFRAYIGNKTNCDGPTAVVPHYIWKLKVWVFFCHFAQQVMFWNLSSLEKLLHIFVWHGKIWTLYTCCYYLQFFFSMLKEYMKCIKII